MADGCWMLDDDDDDDDDYGDYDDYDDDDDYDDVSYEAGYGQGYDHGAESGDLNLDGVANILDIVSLANCVLTDTCGE